jgi:hypothetical protein
MSNPDSIETLTEDSAPRAQDPEAQHALPTEVGGRGGSEPTRYGDWEKNGRCIDF